MTGETFTKIAWNRSRSLQKEDSRNKVETGGEAALPVLATSYSSSAAPTESENDVAIKDADDTSTTKDDEESVQLPVDDGSTDAPITEIDESSDALEFDESLASRIKDLDETSEILITEFNEELLDKTTKYELGEDVEKDLELCYSVSAVHSAAESVATATSLNLSSAVSQSAASSQARQPSLEPSDGHVEECCSVTTLSEIDKAGASDSELQSYVQPSEEPHKESTEDIVGKTLRPPLFPGRSGSNVSLLLKKKVKPGIASFFRSRSNPIKPDARQCMETPLKAPSHDSRVGTRSEAIKNSNSAGRSVASVPSCSEDTIEIIAIDSKMSVGAGSEPNATDPEQGEQPTTPLTGEDVASVKSEACDNYNGLAKDDSSNNNILLEGVYATVSSDSNEIQDPWPNPWLGTASSAPHGTATPPHIVCNTGTETSDFVLESVVGVVLSAGIHGAVAAAASEDIYESAAADRREMYDMRSHIVEVIEEKRGDEIPPNHAACIPDLVKAFNTEECINPSVLEQIAEPKESSEDRRTNTSFENEFGFDQNVESPASLVDWKELLTTENSSFSVDELSSVKSAKGKKTADEEESKGNAHRQSSLWKRTKSMVKTKRHSHSVGKDLHQAARKADTEELKRPKVQKFKLGYLCLFNPCSKKLSTITEVDEASHSGRCPAPEKKGVAVSAPFIREEADKIEATSNGQPAEEEMDESHDDLIDILDQIESCDAAPVEQPFVHQLPYVKQLHHQAELPKVATNVEEAKSDLIQLHVAESKENNRSWLTDPPSMESLMARDPHKSFSDMSTIGDFSDAAAGPNMISSINFYVSLATRAVQHNLYNIPVQELEKLRDLTCGLGPTAEQTSLVDKVVTATESHDSMKVQESPKKSTNPFSLVFGELVDILECGPNPKRNSTSLPNKYEEEKIEMLGSTSRA